jgi:sugar phosphate isomerase/epimerase
MNYSRRDFGKFALGSIPVASAILADPRRFFAAPQAKPNSLINGVQIGVITYSYRSMPDGSAEAMLGYMLADGISACEMESPVWPYAYKRMGYTPPGRGGFPGGAGRGAQAPPAAPGPAIAGQPSWNGQACAAERVGGGGGGRGPLTPEQQAAQDDLHKFQRGVSLDIFKDLRKMYNDAGVSIYAVKILDVNADDELLAKLFEIGKTMGASHLTTELPAHSDTSTATFKRVGDMALKHGMFAAYHTHLQGRIDVFDEAFAASAGNKANIDFGHYVAAGEKGGTPMDFLNKFHDRIGSFHLKDRTLPEHCSLNLEWGKGDTPIKEILRLVRDKKWPLPATIEQEYAIPADSDAVKEVAKCLAYCRAALTS